MGFFNKARRLAKGKKNRLKELTLTSVDFCAQGANPQADITLRKSLFPQPEEASKSEGAQTFRDIQWERGLNEQFWRMQDALAESLRSILSDTGDLDTRRSLMLDSLGEFQRAAAELIDTMCAPEKEPDLPPQREGETNTKGVVKTMKVNELNIDVSALSAEEQAQLSALVEKAVPAGEPAKQEPPQALTPKPAPSETDPALAKAAAAYQAMTKNLEKQLQRLQDQELDQTAEKYAALGDEHLRETLGVMKAAGDTAYAGYLSALDRQLNLLEKTDAALLGEVGKSTHGQSLGGTAVEKASAAAEALCKAEPGLSYQEAMVRAFEADPALAAEYEREYAEGR